LASRLGFGGRGVRRFGDRSEAPFVLFICQNDAQRDDFLSRADHELTGHRWHPSYTGREHEYIGRRHILFCDERDIHLGQAHARRLAPYPPGHPGRQGREADVRGVRLPGSSSGIYRQPTTSDVLATVDDQAKDASPREAA
jgi:hypothetical protein